MSLDLAALRACLADLPRRHPGPGGVAAVLHQGVPVASAAWGHIDLESRQPMTASTRLPLCSITKQFTCAVLLAEALDHQALQDRLARLLPAYQDPLPSIEELCHNQSGFRDYWALSVLHGARAEQPFWREDLTPLLARFRHGHFAPGSRYSYCNLNFRLLADLIEAATDSSLQHLYRRHIWKPAGMTTAVLTCDTRHPEDAVSGHEGNETTGWLPAQNGITWIGDAGISASLQDMIAYEAWIDAGRDDPDHLYARISAPVTFGGGSPAHYGYGLRHMQIASLAATGHSGALRGFRSFRLTCPAARLSVVVMFNHEQDAQAAVLALAHAALGAGTPSAALAGASASPALIAPDWTGLWRGRETGLLARITTGADPKLSHFATSPEPLRATADGTADGPPDGRPDGTGVTSGLATAAAQIQRSGADLQMQRPMENLNELLQPVAAPPASNHDDIAGLYVSDELESQMRITWRDGAAHVWFRGFLGEGRIEPLQSAGPDLWLMQTRRAMDAPAPGDWTLELQRDAQGLICGAQLGCWLARGVQYQRLR